MRSGDTISLRRVRRATYQVMGRTYPTWRLYQTARVRWKWRWLRSENPVLVYQMGKVGSRSVEHALQEAPIGAPVVHVHALAPDVVRRHEQGTAQSFRTSIRERGQPDPEWRVQANARARMIVDHLDRMRQRPPIKIVTLVREPVAQQLSEFFHNLDRRAPDLAARVRDQPAAASTAGALERSFGEVLAAHDPLVWFDDELRTVFEVDVFAGDFDPSAGYSIIRSADVEVLVLRFEDLDEVFEPAVGSFLGVHDVALPHDNTVVGRYYSQVYERLRRSLEIDPDVLDRIYGSSHVRHFYSDEELATFRNRWAA